MCTPSTQLVGVHIAFSAYQPIAFSAYQPITTQRLASCTTHIAPTMPCIPGGYAPTLAWGPAKGASLQQHVAAVATETLTPQMIIWTDLFSIFLQKQSPLRFPRRMG